MILTGIHDIQPTPIQSFTFWEWQSGIPLPFTTTVEESPQINMTTTTMTDATTTAADTNTTAAPPPEEEVVEEQQQQATPTAPAPLLEQ